MNHPLRCRCGNLQGHVALPATTSRAICYCRDCQAFARFLGRADEILDDAGGSDIVATLPQNVNFTQGIDQLACMSLSEKGLLRWYAGCCNTPIGNTPPDYKTPYVGLLHSCLSSASLERSFGPADMRINVESAIRPVKSTPFALVAAITRLMTSMLWAKLRGRYRGNPFFHADSGQPVRARKVLSTSERAALKNPPESSSTEWRR